MSLLRRAHKPRQRLRRPMLAAGVCVAGGSGALVLPDCGSRCGNPVVLVHGPVDLAQVRRHATPRLAHRLALHPAAGQRTASGKSHEIHTRERAAKEGRAQDEEETHERHGVHERLLAIGDALCTREEGLRRASQVPARFRGCASCAAARRAAGARCSRVRGEHCNGGRCAVEARSGVVAGAQRARRPTRETHPPRRRRCARSCGSCCRPRCGACTARGCPAPAAPWRQAGGERGSAQRAKR